MKRTMLGLVVVLAAMLAPAAGAQAPTTTTLSFFEPANGGTFQIVDNAPKSPSKNPGSRKYRFSLGDQILFGQRLFTQKGGTRVGAVYGQFTVVKAGNLSKMLVHARGTFVLTNGDEIEVSGVLRLASPDITISVVGGTGAYAGARGTFSSHNNADNSSQDTLTLLP